MPKLFFIFDPKIISHGGKTPISQIKQIFAGTTARLAGMTTVRKDYVIFSTYDISVLADRYTYIGIFNNFSRIK